MSENEVVLITLLKYFTIKYQRTIILQKYIQRYGALSQEAGNKVREILDERDIFDEVEK